MISLNDEPQEERDARLHGLRERVDVVPARATAGIRAVRVEAGHTQYAMDVPDWIHDADGRAAPGALGILVDTAVGTAVMTAVAGHRAMATSHLHLELLRPIPAGTRTITCDGAPSAVEDRFALGEGVALTEAGDVVARASVGAVLLDTPARFGPGRTDMRVTPSRRGAATERASRPHRLIAGSPVHEELGTRVVSARSTGVRSTALAAPRFGNSGGGMHGGFGVLMGECVLDLALRAALGDRPAMRPVELRAAFLRPIPADGSAVECRAAVVHLGRRLAAARGEVRDQEGRVAVLVDASYVPA
jgi:uncharacterized protein (TIGR00369 family)